MIAQWIGPATMVLVLVLGTAEVADAQGFPPGFTVSGSLKEVARWSCEEAITGTPALCRIFLNALGSVRYEVVYRLDERGQPAGPLELWVTAPGAPTR